jgi:hypothetical protein
MHFTDLVTHTSALPVGRHVIYDLPEGKVIIRNVGILHPSLSPNPAYRLHLYVGGREVMPRHTDFFSDYLLKVQIRPDLRLPLSEACEQVCNGASPQSLMSSVSKHLPRFFAEAGDATWTFQTSEDETGGLPTEVFLCGLQTLIRVYELNGFLDKPREAFRQVFLALEQGKPLPEVVQQLRPEVRPAKRYFNRLERKA